ncbi:MAG: hypothetical protein CFH28_00863, partial [Alphaproteobacteria bacterium MarineAlpha6_Bin6]
INVNFIKKKRFEYCYEINKLVTAY